MNLSEDELKLLRAIEGSNRLGLPCTAQTIQDAKGLVDRGLMAITETGNAVVKTKLNGGC